MREEQSRAFPGRIRLLDALTSNQIAAGEVVERPASVVKELVENAIDADATRIAVKILDQRGEEILVTDNGRGMSPEDLSRAVLPHATSKLRRIEDLDILSTLGFRGEALPSIAAVSQMWLASAPHGALNGYKIAVEEGQAGEIQEYPMAAGTMVGVNRLFYNTPARREFLKSPAYELSKIGELMSKLALALPEIAFSLEMNGKTVLSTNGGGDLGQAVLAVFGRETLGQLVQVDWLENILISGLVSLPELNRANRSQYNFFVNKRWVRCRALSQAVDEAYYTLLPKNRYPVVVLHLAIAPSQIEVNIHPAKTEIRLKEEERIQKALISAIQGALSRKEQLIPKISGSSPQSPPLGQGDGSLRLEEKERRKLYLKERRRLEEGQGQILSGRQEGARLFYGSPAGKNSASPLKEEEGAGSKPLNAHDPFPWEAAAAEKPPFLYASLRPLGQIGASYIAAEGRDGLYLIDQHAAHERILYEKFAAKAAEEPGASQALAIPLTLELSHEEAGLLTEAILDLQALGFVLEHFGDNTFMLRAVPAWYEGSAPQELVYELLAQGHPGGGLRLPREEELFLRACKSAVKANQHLEAGDIYHLLAQLDQCQNPSTCPHGRPVAIKLTFEEIRKKFLRTGLS